MDINFVYDKEKHEGYLNGKLIPSVTQLLSCKHKDLDNVPKSVLSKKATRGTLIHADIEGSANFDLRCGTPEGKNWEKLMRELGLEVVKCEDMILIPNSVGDIVCYGTYDLIVRTSKAIVINRQGKFELRKQDEILNTDTIIYEEGDLLIADNKTVAALKNEKVSEQVSLYQLGIPLKLNGAAVFWLKEDTTQFRPIELKTMDQSFELLDELLKLWKEECENER